MTSFARLRALARARDSEKLADFAARTTAGWRVANNIELAEAATVGGLEFFVAARTVCGLDARPPALAPIPHAVIDAGDHALFDHVVATVGFPTRQGLGANAAEPFTAGRAEHYAAVSAATTVVNAIASPATGSRQALRHTLRRALMRVIN